MNTEFMNELLATLSGHLEAETPQESADIQDLQAMLGRALLAEDVAQVKGSRFAFENADLFSINQVSPERAAALRTIAEQQTGEAAAPEFRVFVREVPVRSTQIHASAPLWAGGAKVERTLGPFLNADGRFFWFDFFRIEKLLALSIQGHADPALLFHTSLLSRFLENLPFLNGPPAYSLPAGSIWINAQLLATDAPAGTFTGLTIQGGSVMLSEAPQVVGDKITVTPTTTVRVQLELQQPDVTDADPSSPYGIDARDLVLELPRRLEFHFSGQGRVFDEIDNARWTLYGEDEEFHWDAQTQPHYDNVLHRVMIPFTSSVPNLKVSDCQSPFYTLRGQAPIARSAWALPAAPIDLSNPTAAAGIGGMAVQCNAGLANIWKGLDGGELALKKPILLVDPGRIALTDLFAATIASRQSLTLWKDEANPHASSVALQFPPVVPFYYNSVASGVELLMTVANAEVKADRPVTVAAQALAIFSKNSLFLLGVTKQFKLVYLFDDNLLFDNLDLTKKVPALPPPISFALHNALFKTTPVNGCLLFGTLDDAFAKVERGSLFLTFGLMAYLPTLPDPYAANIGALKFQFRGGRSALYSAQQTVWMWLVGFVQWKPELAGKDKVKVSFHFAPLQNQFLVQTNDTTSANPAAVEVAAVATQRPNLCETVLTPRQDFRSQIVSKLDAAQTPALNPSGGLAEGEMIMPEGAELMAQMVLVNKPNYDAQWNSDTGCLQQDFFALLDVSTNADLMGISVESFDFNRGNRRVDGSDSVYSAQFPFQVDGMDVVSRGNNVRAFTVPQISWEPVLNTAPQAIIGVSANDLGDPPGYPPLTEPRVVPNYYPDDGGPTRIFNNSVTPVPLSPLPLVRFLFKAFEDEPGNVTSALFTLPFGMRALALLSKFANPKDPPKISIEPNYFAEDIRGGLHVEFHAGKLPTDKYPMFQGATAQMGNVLDMNGNPSYAGTLGASVGDIFNREFSFHAGIDPLLNRGVPLTRIDFSGYGASIFSDWFNPNAQMAMTSQTKFDVWVGRTAHEVVQVKSIIYPWGIRVVRTIILYRSASGYEYRVDTGWQAQSDGRFDFSYYLPKGGNPEVREAHEAGYQFHPGVVKGLFNVKNIIEENIPPLTDSMTIPAGQTYLDENNAVKIAGAGGVPRPVRLRLVTFDTDVEIEGVIQGAVNGRVPSKKVRGYVQLAPGGIPLTVQALRDVLNSQPDPIGGPMDCVVDIGKNGQKLRVNRIDVTNSVDAGGAPAFVVAARGSVILPKDGSWSMVQHARGTGEVTPLPTQLAVPLIRAGAIKYNKVSDAGGELMQLNPPDPKASLLRIANPPDILRAPVAETVNYGFLLNTDTQKALFLTPAYKLLSGGDKPMLLTKTPPLFVDAFRIVNSKAIFPNVGDAETNLGQAISLYAGGNEFDKDALMDGTKQVLRVMQINKDMGGGVVQEGFKLLKNPAVPTFKLPNLSKTLIEVNGAFKIYIEYKADNVNKGKDDKGNPVLGSFGGELDFDVDSFAGGMNDRWKSMMSNVALVLDLGPIPRLVTIKGNWDAKNGAEAAYGGGANVPQPQLEFSKELQPVIDILQILQDLQGENYAGAFQKGLKLAMSNKAGSWEYKLEASKEIPVVKFPPPPFDNDPNAPLKLEAGLKLGAYFNAALQIPTDTKQLLPSAGGYLGFYGKLSVMCVSLSIATVYAVGQVNLDIGADTAVGPTLHMKFGFGAQVVVGLPVVGNVSVLYMVGVEIYTDKTQLQVAGFLLFQGHAELLAGMVSITITIEAKGTVSRTSDPNNHDNDRTDLAAQVTFAIDISIFLVIDISFSKSWTEQRQIA